MNKVICALAASFLLSGLLAACGGRSSGKSEISEPLVWDDTNWSEANWE
jgi:hypothetical protein